MKLRCAYCNHTFTETCSRCPRCRRILKLPPALRQRPLKEREKARERIAREAEKRRKQRLALPMAGRRSPAVLFAILMVLLVTGGALISRITETTAPAQPRTRDMIAHQDLRVLRIALERFRIDQGRYPTAEEGLKALLRDPGTVTNWQRHYITLLKPDPWGSDYLYEPGPDSVTVRSAGPDLTPFTDADLVSPPITPADANWPPPE